MTQRHHRAAAGFTLIELMITVSIAAVLMAVAVPGFQSYARNATVAQASGSFVNAAQLARSNAMRLSRHTLVQVVDSTLGWTGGWRVYADMNRDMNYTADTDALIAEQGPSAEGVMNDGPKASLQDRGTVADGYLMFNPAGFPRTVADGISNGSVVFYLPEGRATAVIYSTSGRIRRCDPTRKECRDK